MNKVLVSACIITYNQQAYIAQCIDAALSQQIQGEYEIVIGDDCSTDGTTAICRQYAEKYPEVIRFIERGKNLGMNGNWTETIHACKGQYIAVCEGDDYWTDDSKLQRQIDFLESHPECSFSFHKGLKMSGENLAGAMEYPQNIHIESLDAAAFFSIVTIPTASVVYRNDFLYAEPGHSHPDFLLYSTLLSKGRAGFIDRVMSVYRLHEGGISSNYNSHAYLERRIAEMSKERYFQIFTPAVRREIDKILVQHVFHYAQLKRGKLDFSSKRRLTSLVIGSRSFYTLGVKDYMRFFKILLK
jgi:glycosyltransferase involved in cell wall biosynthesis